MSMSAVTQQKQIPEPGQVVRVRTRTYLVESVTPGLGGHQVTMACLDDDAQGQTLEAVWEVELGTEILDGEAWKSIGAKGFDSPRFFGAYSYHRPRPAGQCRASARFGRRGLLSQTGERNPTTGCHPCGFGRRTMNRIAKMPRK
jgi:hypothetical protein